MSAASSKMTSKMEIALAALLTEPTHALAAAKAGVADKTLQRWLQIPEFASAFKKARQAVLDGAIGRLQVSTTKAVDALERSLTCGNPANETRAAIAILDKAIAGAELLEINERLSALEKEAEAEHE